MNSNLKYLINKLEKVKRLNFKVNHPNPSLNIHLNCNLKVSKPDDSTIITEELGDWVNNYGQKVNSKNIYKWTAHNNSILKLEHLRFGEKKPVFLVSFYNEKNNLWKSLKPYICEQDLYYAELFIAPTSIKLTWNIKTPKHTYTITSTYYS
ncbi:MAG: hypothetical protein IIA48_04500 [Bacteroidetes bacterium]|nr:hypothetical protein [Bacteroidota bacterium]